jgi:hypothetical protein
MQIDQGSSETDAEAREQGTEGRDKGPKVTGPEGRRNSTEKTPESAEGVKHPGRRRKVVGAWIEAGCWRMMGRGNRKRDPITGSVIQSPEEWSNHRKVILTSETQELNGGDEMSSDTLCKMPGRVL